jgi:hypothetical protein
MNYEREIFKPYLELRFKQASAITYGEKLEIVELLIEETKNGKLPIQDGQVIRLNPNSTAVTAVREGKTVSIDKSIQKTVRAATAQKGKAKKNALIALSLLMVIPILGGLWWLTSRGSNGDGEIASEGETAVAEIITSTVTIEPSPTLTGAEIGAQIPTLTPIPTSTPLPTFTPVPVASDQYEVRLDEENTVADQNNPIAIRLLEEEYQVSTAKMGATWEPTGVEWWPGTHVRRLFAMPYHETLLTHIFAGVGEVITIRLRTGAAISYRLDNVERVHAAQIERLTAKSPSIAIVLYGEEGNGRWLVTGSAIQETILPSIEQPIAQEQINGVTINQCEQAGNQVRCILTLTQLLERQRLLITDSGWLDGLAHLPPTEQTIIKETDGAITVQLAGVVRTSETAVLVFRGDDGHVIQEIERFISPEIQQEETN